MYPRRGATASVLRDFNPKLYNDRILRTLTVLWYLAEFLDLFGLATNNRPSRIISIVLRYFYLSVTVVSCSVNIHTKCRKFRYCNCKRSLKDILGDVGDDDYYGFVAMAITLASALGQALCPAVEPGGMFFVNTYTPTFLVVYTSIISVMALVTCIIPNRIAMNNSLKLQDELNHRRVFVRLASAYFMMELSI